MYDEHKIMRRVGGFHNLRMDGIGDLLCRVRGSSVMDIGCNRGMVAYEFANNGAAIVHGCDSYAPGIECAREIFMDMRNVKSQFEVVDLTQGPIALKPFGNQRYDIVLLLATYHKLKRVMSADGLSSLINELGKRTLHHFAWRATGDKPEENEEEMLQIDRDLNLNFKRIHTSYLSEMLGVAAIWKRL